MKNLRQKVDEEFKQQLKNHEIHFEKLRTQENLEVQKRQAVLEKLEEKRLENQINKLQERIWHLISDRASLFGAPQLKDNADFKNDIRALTEQALTEEFELRRREITSMLPSSRSLMARHRFSHGLSRYAGWIISLCLLGLIFYAQFWPMLHPERRPASTSMGQGH